MVLNIKGTVTTPTLLGAVGQPAAIRGFANPGVVLSSLLTATKESIRNANSQTGGIVFLFGADTTAADPGAGYIRLNNAALSLATEAYVSAQDSDGAEVGAALDLMDDSTSAVNRAVLYLRSGENSGFAIFKVVGDVVDAGGYRKLTIQHVISSVESFEADHHIGLSFNVAGDKASAAGGDKQVQFRDGTEFAGSADFTFNKTTNTLSVTGNIEAVNALYGGSVFARGASAQVGIHRRDTKALAWSLYSTSGDLAVYDNPTGVDVLKVRASGELSVMSNLTLKWDAISGASIQSFSTKPLTLNPAGNPVVIGAGSPQLIFGNSGNPATLWSGGAGVLELRNAAQAMNFRVYNTYTDTANYERGFLRWNANILELGNEAGGTGIARTVRLRGPQLAFSINGLDKWVIDPSGHLLAYNSDNDHDIGAPTQRPRSVYVGTSVAIGTNGLVASWTPGTGGTIQTFNFPLFLNPAGNNVIIGAGSIASLQFTSSLGAPILTFEGNGNALAQRNGASPQSFRIYGTYTDSANYSRLALYRDGAYGWTFGTQAAGTGTQDAIALIGYRLRILTGTGGVTTPVWRFESNGHLLPEADNVYDVGGLTARVRSGYFASTLSIGGGTTFPQGAAAERGLLTVYGPSTDNNWGGEIALRSANGLNRSGMFMQSGNVVLYAQSNVVEQRGGANPQTFRLYQNFTDSANYSRLALKFNGGFAYLTTEAVGTGVMQNIAVVAGANSNLLFGANNSGQWYLTTAGHLSPFGTPLDNLFDLGLPNSRPRTGYFGTSVFLPKIDFFQDSPDVYKIYRTGTSIIYQSAGFSTFQQGSTQVFGTFQDGLIVYTYLRGAGGVIEQRQALVAQTYRLYNTYTDTANYERLSVGWSSNILNIKAEAAGTGVVRTVQIDGVSIKGASLGLSQSMSLGFNATAGGTGSVAVGVGASVGSSGVALGETAVAGGGSSLALGYHAITATGTGAIALGALSSATGNASIAIGMGAVAPSSRMLVIGSATDPNLAVTDAFIGSGWTSAAPQSITLHASGGSGLDINGANITIAGGQPTGAGVGGSIFFATAGASSSGTTLRALVNRWSVGQAGHIIPVLDNAYDLGENGGARIRNIYAAGLALGTVAGGAYAKLVAEGTGVLAQSGGTSPQTLRIYNTYTDTANYERAYAGWAGNTFTIATEKAGTGTARAIQMIAAAGADIFFGVGSLNWQIDSNGTLRTDNDGVRDIGLSGSKRPRNINASNSMRVGTNAMLVDSGLRLGSGSSIAFTGAASDGTPDTVLTRDGAAIFAMRQSGATPYTLRIYNTYTDTANYERGYSRWASNVYEIGTEAAGTGIKRPLRFDGQYLEFRVGGTSYWLIDNGPAGVLRPIGDNLIDLATTSQRIRTGYFGTSVVVGSSDLMFALGTGTATIDTQSSRTLVFNPSGNPVRINPFGGLQFGSTSNVPTLFGSGSTVLQQRNGLNPQSFHLFNTYTDAANNERGELSWSGSVLLLQTAASGTGVLRGLRLNAASMAFQTAGVTQWSIQPGGSFTAGLDNTVDIGATASGRPRSVYIGSSLVVGSMLTVNAENTLLDTNLMFNTDNVRDIGTPTSFRPRIGYFGTSVFAESSFDLFATSPGSYGLFRTSTTTEMRAGSIASFKVGSTIAMSLNTVAAFFNVPITSSGGSVEFRSTVPHSLRVYNTYTDAANYERAEIGFISSQLRFWASNAGTGAAKPVSIGVAGNAQVFFAIGGVTRWFIAESTQGYAFAPYSSDNVLDLGLSGSRIRTGYFGTSVQIGGGGGGLLGLTTIGSTFPNAASGAGRLTLNRGSDGFGWTLYPDSANKLTLTTGSGGAQTIRATWSDGGDLTINGTVKTSTYTTADLPTAATAGNGAQAYVTDATLAYTGANIGSPYVGGGTNHAPIRVVNGTWVIG